MSGFVMEFSGITNTDTATTTIAITSAVPSGETLVASVITQNSFAPLHFPTAKDSRDNQWRFIRSVIVPGTDTVVSLLYAYIVRPMSSGDTVIVSHNENADRAAISVAQYNDALTADVGAEGDNGGGAATTLTTAATATTTDANELIVGAFGLLSAARNFTATNGFTGLAKIVTTNGSVDRAIVAEYKYVASTGAYTANGTLDVSSQYGGIVQSFRLAVPPDTRYGRPKSWNGAAWVTHDAKTWTGSAWVQHKMKGRKAVESWVGPFGATTRLVIDESFDKIPVGQNATIGNTKLSVVFGSSTGVAGLHSNAIRFSVGATLDFAYGSYTLVEKPQQFRLRTYIRVANNPSNIFNIFGIRDPANVALASLQLSTTGKIRMRNGFTLAATSTTSAPIGQWMRLEWLYDGVTGTQALRLFLGANLEGTVPDEEITGIGAVVGRVDRLSYGIVEKTTSVTIDFDEFGFQSDYWIDSK